MTAARNTGAIPVLSERQRLMVAREYAALNQSELANRLGVSTATVQRAESGKTRPRKTTFMAWALATGVDLYWLETGKTPAGNDPDGGSGCAIRDSNPEPAGLGNGAGRDESSGGVVVPLRPAASPADSDEDSDAA